MKLKHFDNFIIEGVKDYAADHMHSKAAELDDKIYKAADDFEYSFSDYKRGIETENKIYQKIKDLFKRKKKGEEVQPKIKNEKEKLSYIQKKLEQQKEELTKDKSKIQTLKAIRQKVKELE